MGSMTITFAPRRFASKNVRMGLPWLDQTGLCPHRTMSLEARYSYRSDSVSAWRGQPPPTIF